MGINYTKLAQTAERLISSNGKSLTLRRNSSGTFDPATNAITGDSDTDYTVSGVFELISRNLVDGTNIKKEDRYVLVGAEGLSIAIQEKDVIIEGSDRWNILNVEEIKPADIVVYYKLQVRK